MAIAEHDNIFIFVPNLIGKFRLVNKCDRGNSGAQLIKIIDLAFNNYKIYKCVYNCFT